MQLRGIEFGNIMGASGVQGFFGEGYWFHPFLKPFGLDFEGMTFTAKTTTLAERAGNMPLTRSFAPREYLPRCIKVQPMSGNMLNAVGLSGPGLQPLLDTGRWQQRTAPFWLSVMSVAPTRLERMEELRQTTSVLAQAKSDFATAFGLQYNNSCPNTGHNVSELIEETAEALDILGPLGVPLMVKVTADTPIEPIVELNDHPHLDALCVSNTFKFGAADINWDETWGSSVSPLADLGGGGLSGKILRPIVCNWIRQVRNAGFTKPINGGGGILTKQDVWEYRYAGASSVFIGSVAALRPWRVRPIIREANSLTWKN